MSTHIEWWHASRASVQIGPSDEYDPDDVTTPPLALALGNPWDSLAVFVADDLAELRTFAERILAACDAAEPAPLELEAVTLEDGSVHVMCPSCGALDTVREVERTEGWRELSEVGMATGPFDAEPFLRITFGDPNDGDGAETDHFECGGRYIESRGCGQWLAIDPDLFDFDYA